MAKRRTLPEGEQRVVVESGMYRKSSGKYLAHFGDRPDPVAPARGTRTRLANHRRSVFTTEEITP